MIYKKSIESEHFKQLHGLGFDEIEQHRQEQPAVVHVLLVNVFGKECWQEIPQPRIESQRGVSRGRNGPGRDGFVVVRLIVVVLFLYALVILTKSFDGQSKQDMYAAATTATRKHLSDGVHGFEQCRVEQCAAGQCRQQWPQQSDDVAAQSCQCHVQNQVKSFGVASFT